jgi:hypothetical protein
LRVCGAVKVSEVSTPSALSTVYSITRNAMPGCRGGRRPSDNTTATFTCGYGGSNSSLSNGIAWVQATAHPLPSSLLPYFYDQILMQGT